MGYYRTVTARTWNLRNLSIDGSLWCAASRAERLTPNEALAAGDKEYSALVCAGVGLTEVERLTRSRSCALSVPLREAD